MTVLAFLAAIYWLFFALRMLGVFAGSNYESREHWEARMEAERRELDRQAEERAAKKQAA